MKPPTILVIDDDEAIIDATSLILEEEGFAVKTNSDALHLLPLKAPYPDLILLDILMTGISGLDICRQIKSNKHTRHIPVILFSANRQAEKLAKQHRADDFITKPFDMQSLITSIERHLLT